MIMYNMDKLKRLRKEHKLTVYEMARRLHITPSFYSQIENQKRRLFYDVACRISLIFNMQPDNVFYTSRKPE